MMLTKIDLDRVFRAAHRKGYRALEIYAEQSLVTHVTYFQRLQKVSFQEIGGVSLRCEDNGNVRIFTSASPSTRSLLRLLEDGEAADASAAHPELFLDPSANEATFAVLDQWNKELAGMPGLSDQGKLTFWQHQKQFEVATQERGLCQGTENQASLTFAGCRQSKQGDRAPFSWSHHRAGTQELLKDLTERFSMSQVARQITKSPSRWPAPRGEFSLFWSPRAFSRIALQFLRGFEGDLFLGNHSFLTEMTGPLPLPFRIDDLACETSIDHEGFPRKNMTFFRGGKPKGLACNEWIADQLSVPSTGHCRRESFQSAPTVGFWHPIIRGNELESDPLERMDSGIFVDEVEILGFHPRSADLTLRLSDASLVHHGERGEAIEPVTLKVPLIQLLQRCKVFSTNTEVFGFPLTKHGSRFLTEVEAPAVLSAPVPFPGTVPANHYW